MNVNHFIILYNYFKEKGENLLDDYSECVYWNWNSDDDNYIDRDDYAKIQESLSKMRRLKLMDVDFISESRYNAKQAFLNWCRFEEMQKNKPRRIASSYISKKSVRESVFALYGKICLCCGSFDNIQIDHITSVKNGGENSIENFQPLCKSCNVKKGTKTIDYRSHNNI
jgi:5-methylcytosine-specific restriction endonuclease McrA